MRILEFFSNLNDPVIALLSPNLSVVTTWLLQLLAMNRGLRKGMGALQKRSGNQTGAVQAGTVSEAPELLPGTAMS